MNVDDVCRGHNPAHPAVVDDESLSGLFNQPAFEVATIGEIDPEVGADLKIGQQNLQALLVRDSTNVTAGRRLSHRGGLNQENADKARRNDVSDAHDVLLSGLRN